jgi:hypothetical protein
LPSDLITKNVIGLIVTPAPAPPAKTSFGELPGKSDPPDTNPNDTFDIGIIVVPPGTAIASPIIVFASTNLRILSIEVDINPSKCCAIIV